MRRPSVLAFCAAFFLVAACGSIGGPQAHTLSLAYKTGESYKYTLPAILNYSNRAESFTIPFNYDQDNPTGTGSVHVTSKNKYVRDEQVKSVNTAVVQSNLASNIDLTIDMSALGGQGGTSLFPSTGALKSLSMKGTTTSDVTSWIDSSAHRLVKTHSTGTVDATMTLNMAAGGTTPGLTGPIPFKRTQTMDMNPA